MHGPDQWHGQGGELRVEERRVNWEILDAWREAAEQSGIPKIEEFNRGDNFGNSYFQMNQRRGTRWSASRGFLRPALDRQNLTVFTNAHMQSLLTDSGEGRVKAQGVRVLLGNADLQDIRARREVLLAAGSIGSPQLLQLSGIGSGKVLQDAGVPVLHDLPGVGENLQDHLQIRTIYKVSNTVTLNQRYNSLTDSYTHLTLPTTPYV